LPQHVQVNFRPWLYQGDTSNFMRWILLRAYNGGYEAATKARACRFVRWAPRYSRTGLRPATMARAAGPAFAKRHHRLTSCSCRSSSDDGCARERDRAGGSKIALLHTVNDEIPPMRLGLQPSCVIISCSAVLADVTRGRTRTPARRRKSSELASGVDHAHDQVFDR